MGPELSFLKDIGRAEFYTVTDQEALDGNLKANNMLKISRWWGMKRILMVHLKTW